MLLTSGTVTSARLLAERLPKGSIHQFVPVDHPDWVKSFLDHWKPDLALWSESDFWPNLLEQARQRKIPMVLLQGRISPKSFTQWQRFPRFIRHILGHFDLCLAQSPGDTERLIQLGAKAVHYDGNLKLAVPPLPAPADELERLLEHRGARPTWIAASTHQGEELVGARIHATLKPKHPGLLTIIIPRHPPRAMSIASELAAKGLQVAVRSKDTYPQPDTDIFLVDTIGELGLFFRLSKLVFMGKSLCAEGGQNPFEPARLGAAVLFGPRMSNFTDMTHSMLAAKAAIEVRDEPHLQEQVDTLLADPAALDRTAQAALLWAESEADILDRFITRLSPYLDRLHEGS